jgi:hypothetical protein
MKKILLYVSLFLIVSTNSYTQENKPTPRERFFWGGNLWLQFGTFTYIEVAPEAGYRITPRFSAGLGLKYQFTKQSYYVSTSGSSIYGAKVFARYTLIKDFSEYFKAASKSGIFIHAEDELLNLEKGNFGYYDETASGRFFLNSVLLGPGLKQPLGDRAYAYFMVLWVLTETNRTPYESPTFRIGFNVQLKRKD